MEEFIVLRRGEPILFGLALLGVTWASREHLFEKPIEKVGQDLELFWGGKLIDNSREGVIKVLAHWKKQLLRRAKRGEKSLDSFVDLGRLTNAERREMLASVDRISPRGDRIEVVMLRTGRGANQSFRTLIRSFSGRKLVGSTTVIEHTKDQLSAKVRKLIRGLDFSEDQLNEAEVFGYTSMEDFLGHDHAENKRSRPLAKAFAWTIGPLPDVIREALASLDLLAYERDLIDSFRNMLTMNSVTEESELDGLLDSLANMFYSLTSHTRPGPQRVTFEDKRAMLDQWFEEHVCGLEELNLIILGTHSFYAMGGTAKDRFGQFLFELSTGYVSNSRMCEVWENAQEATGSLEEALIELYSLDLQSKLA